MLEEPVVLRRHRVTRSRTRCPPPTVPVGAANMSSTSCPTKYMSPREREAVRHPRVVEVLHPTEAILARARCGHGDALRLPRVEHDFAVVVEHEMRLGDERDARAVRAAGAANVHPPIEMFLRAGGQPLRSARPVAGSIRSISPNSVRHS